jgi:Na+/pantothenate symporter
MKEIDQRATAVLLASLDTELDLKCKQLKEKQKETKLQKIFFFSCLFIMFSFLLQALFRVFNLNFLFIFWAYQGLALFFLAPLVLNFNRGGIFNE